MQKSKLLVQKSKQLLSLRCFRLVFSTFVTFIIKYVVLHGHVCVLIMNHSSFFLLVFSTFVTFITKYVVLHGHVCALIINQHSPFVDYYTEQPARPKWRGFKSYSRITESDKLIIRLTRRFSHSAHTSFFNSY